jgi:hypothetical protein
MASGSDIDIEELAEYMDDLSIEEEIEDILSPQIVVRKR